LYAALITYQGEPEMLTMQVTIKALCDQCGHSESKYLPDGSPRQLRAATRRNLANHGWQLDNRNPWRRHRPMLCPGCKMAPVHLPPPADRVTPLDPAADALLGDVFKSVPSRR